MILIGAQGAGKGTYAAILTKKYDIPHIYSKEMKSRRIEELKQLKIEIETMQNDLSNEYAQK